MDSRLLHYRPQLESTPWFRGLPVELQDYLMSHATLLRLEKGQLLYRCGDPSYGLYAVLEGALSVGTVGIDGKESLLAVLGPTAWVGEISMFDGLPRPHDAIAVSRALFMHVPEAALQNLLDTTPRYWREFALLMAQRLRLSFKSTESLALQPAAQRIASRLLLIAEGYDGLNAVQSKIRLSQDSLASMVSLSRQTTNQLLKSLESQQIISLKFGEIQILDIERLRAASVGASRL
ncbi:Crp/Fnr family transcriptional regulator [Paraburkholderia terrae]|uniref:cAMP-binding domain of CRP or a regulatory subunit of cAMP-dependent protein kinases n=1 Tax=Paraburkholderia steynii TaxID=1245441 RepID=A0A7Z7B9F6_9BURK|nr:MULTISPECIES: Crp/Fnr family transcriptional regulator [Paraburkholderia]MDW3663046.1 Crp/Fnr family transcriptional regulator [Paraburkholderia terrae]BDC43997.1 Crp/Fnr family transcriptional regulator [Paraburkholderia terrae]SDI19702.1 cAMP-binding domain of CRP or a regulatory subunit of cAMP-dependent protein kinases [Paraburkholderia steynii]